MKDKINKIITSKITIYVLYAIGSTASIVGIVNNFSTNLPAAGFAISTLVWTLNSLYVFHIATIYRDSYYEAIDGWQRAIDDFSDLVSKIKKEVVEVDDIPLASDDEALKRQPEPLSDKPY